MAAFLKNLLYAGILLVIIGLLFKILHYTGATMLYYSGSLLIVIGGGGLIFRDKTSAKE